MGSGQRIRVTSKPGGGQFIAGAGFKHQPYALLKTLLEIVEALEQSVGSAFLRAFDRNFLFFDRKVRRFDVGKTDNI
jgi:hypothetical protein